MPTETDEDHLSRISTCWSLVIQAHGDNVNDVVLARKKLLERYCGAIFRYALAALHDPAAAEELLQQFAYTFLRGDFQIANPNKGRFRDLVKSVLFHLIVNHQRQQRQNRSQSLDTQLEIVASPQDAPGTEADRQFLKLWREELLDRTWAALEEFDRVGGHSWYATLRHYSQSPNLSSEHLAKALSSQLDRPFNSSSVRQILHRAREKFASLLIDEIGRSLNSAHRDAIEQELIDLDLLIYCKSSLGKKFPVG
ncbi:MAG: hypothetical protein ABL921_01720 [Pirellula sp.]